MEQIETQVTDLRYLAQHPAPPPPPPPLPPTAGAGAGAGAVASAAMIPFSDSASASVSAYETTPQPHLASPGSASPGHNSALDHNGNLTGIGSSSSFASNPNKRKSMDVDDGSATAAAAPGDGHAGGQKQTRSKRNRYISLACNECKRRKIKCNGQTPCQRCGHLNLTCLYAANCCSGNFKDTEDFKHVTAQIDHLQDEMARLNQTVRALQQSAQAQAQAQAQAPAHTDPGPSPRDLNLPRVSSVQGPGQGPLPRPHSSLAQPRSEPPNARRGEFRGPTSMAFSLDVANRTISNMGYQGLSDSDNHLAAAAAADDVSHLGIRSRGDPLLEFDKDEMVRICRVHEDEVGMMYPVLDINAVIAHAKSLAGFFESVKGQPPPEVINDHKTLELKMIMCSGLLMESHGNSDKAKRIYDSVDVILNRKMLAEHCTVADLPVLALLAGYRYLHNDEVLAWRLMGHVGRLCLEMGIHQRDSLDKIKDPMERRNALISFWAAYVLDRRWAFATGLPYAIQDDDIDPELPFPDDYPFIVAMIYYSRLAAKVWRQVYHFGPVLARELRQEDIERLDQEAFRWYETIPDEVKMQSWDQQNQTTSAPSYNLHRLRILTYLRRNQIRIWLYTPILHSATSIMVYPLQAQTAVDLAKDTIQLLSHINNTTNIYRRSQILYHQFLSSSIAVLFLASVHAPVRFSAVCREEFYMALELVKDLSAKSFASQRLWRTIRSLKDVAPRFGLNPDDHAHSSAALGMMGLARGQAVSSSASSSSAATAAGTPLPQLATSRPSASTSPLAAGEELTHNGARIQNEMSRIFEGYVGLNGFQVDGRAQGLSDEVSSTHSAVAGGGIWAAPDGTVFPYFKDMF